MTPSDPRQFADTVRCGNAREKRIRVEGYGWVFSYSGPPFSKWNLSWGARCRHCYEYVTKFDYTPEESEAVLRAHVDRLHVDGSTEPLLGGLSADAEGVSDPGPADAVSTHPANGIGQRPSGPLDFVLGVGEVVGGVDDLGSPDGSSVAIQHDVNDALTPPECQGDIDAHSDGPLRCANCGRTMAEHGEDAWCWADPIDGSGSAP